MSIVNSAASTYLYGSNEYLACELYSIGGSLYLTTNTTPIFGATVAVVRRGVIKSSLGLQVDSVDVTIANGALQYGGVALAVAAANGALDGASLTVERVLNGTIRVVRWTGAIQQVEPRSSETRIVAQSLLASLDVPVPARTFKPNCPYVFKGANCGYAGGTPTCDKTVAQCNHASRNRLTRFGGFPSIPKPPGAV